MIEALGISVAVLLLIPSFLLLVQVAVASLPAREESTVEPIASKPRPRVAVLVPAHNESVGILDTLLSIRLQLGPLDRILVVADNCSDDTAKVAATGGAEVVERANLAHRGKGYALDFGVRHLESAPPDVVLIIDADCQLHAGSLDRLASLAVEKGRPVQALYVMHAPPGGGLKIRLAEFAWVVKNHARPLGFSRLGLPCQLMGSGMAFPWEMIRAAPLATGHLVEDMQLGLDLAAAGTPPLFCVSARVTSLFPNNATGITDQRARWEQGHLAVMLREGPRALGRALMQRRPALAAMVLDMAVPPLTMLVLVLVLETLLIGTFVALGGAALPLMLALTALAAVGAAVALSWWKFARQIVTVGELLRVPIYMLAKLPMYIRFLKPGKREWIRTRRDDKKSD